MQLFVYDDTKLPNMKIWICPILKNVSVLKKIGLNLHGINELKSLNQ
jgi:hypothetical protein